MEEEHAGITRTRRLTVLKLTYWLRGTNSSTLDGRLIAMEEEHARVIKRLVREHEDQVKSAPQLACSQCPLGPVDPSSRALSGRLKFTVRRRKFNKDSLSCSPCTHSEAAADGRAPRRHPQLHITAGALRRVQTQILDGWLTLCIFFVFFFFTLVTGPKTSLSLKWSAPRVCES